MTITAFRYSVPEFMEDASMLLLYLLENAGAALLIASACAFAIVAAVWLVEAHTP